MTLDVRLLDPLSIVAPLGIAFTDAMTGTPIREGLGALVYAPKAPGKSFASRVGPSGIHVWSRYPRRPLLPGETNPRFGQGDDAYWQGNLPSTDVIVEVRDTLGLFLPCSFSLKLPVRDLFTPECVTAARLNNVALGRSGVPLFPAAAAGSRGAARALVRGAVAVRAHANAPLVPRAYARVDVSFTTAPSNGNAPVTTRLSTTLCDHAGRFALAFPYPTPPKFSATERPSWKLSFTVFSSSEIAERAPRLSPATGLESGPDLCAALAQDAVVQTEHVRSGAVSVTPNTPLMLSLGMPADAGTIVVSPNP